MAILIPAISANQLCPSSSVHAIDTKPTQRVLSQCEVKEFHFQHKRRRGVNGGGIVNIRSGQSRNAFSIYQILRQSEILSEQEKSARNVLLSLKLTLHISW